MKNIIFAIFLVSLSLAYQNVFSQKALKKAERAYSEKQYSAAVTYYKDASAKKGLDAPTNLKFGNCYYYTKNYLKAFEIYDQIPEDKMGVDNYFIYAKLLQWSGQYDKAKTFYTKALAGNHSSAAIKNYMKSSTWAKDNIDEGPQNITKIQTNYPNIIFSTDVFYEDLIYASAINSRPKTVDKKRPYLDYLYSYFENASSTGTPRELSASILYPYHDGSITFTRDGKTLYFTYAHTNPKTQVTIFKIYRSDHTGTEWGKAVELPINSNTYSCVHPAISPNGETLFYASNNPSSIGGYDLFVTYKDGDVWSAPQNLGTSINTAGDELFPYLYISGELFFASDGHAGYGGLDIFVANSEQDIWTNVTNMQKPVNSGADDFAFVINPNAASKVVFSSNRNQGVRDDFEFTTPKDVFIEEEEPIVEVVVETPPVIDPDPPVSNTQPALTNVNQDTPTKSYCVQIMATRTLLDPNNQVFKGLPVDRYKIGEFYRYTTGQFFDTIKAKTHMEQLVRIGFKDAFVVSYDGQEDKLEVSSDGGGDAGSSQFPNEKGIVYRVQFKSTVEEPQGNDPKLIKLKSHFDGRYTDLTDCGSLLMQMSPVAHYRYLGLFRWTTGEFRDKTKAIKLMNEMQREGYKDAFVATFQDGRRMIIPPVNR